MTDNIIMILGNEIMYHDAPIDINELRFYEKNPRVLSELMRMGGLAGSYEDKQKSIQELLIKEPSVEKLRKAIKDQGGIMEPLIVQHRTMEVLEGNSRLAALKVLYEREQDEAYLTAPCRMVNIDEDEIDALLHLQHIDGKTEWSPYAKAYKAYDRVVEDEVEIEHYAKITSTNVNEIRKRIVTIQLMKEQGMDTQRDRFSYYDVVVRSRKLKPHFEAILGLKDYVLQSIKQDEPPFDARQLRDELPRIAEKPKVLRKLMNGNIEFSDALERSRKSKPKELIAKARRALGDVGRQSIEKLDHNEMTAIDIEIKKCGQKVEFIKTILKKLKDSGNS